MTESPLLQIDGLSKSYPGVRANDDISLAVSEGEIHALLGENGAGKSTLVKMIYGLAKPDRGSMKIAGKPYSPETPSAARRLGVAMVFQHFSLFDALTVAENIVLGMDEPPPRASLGAKIAEISHQYGLPVDPDRFAGDLSAGQRQRVEIVRCLLQHPRLLIMDEPTSVLTPQEVDELFATLRKLRGDRCSILYISHKLEEIRTLCDTATILRGGRKVAALDPRRASARQMAETMVGSDFSTPARAKRQGGAARLVVRQLSLSAPDAFATALHDISFEARGGEILGIGGVAGNGQDELMAALSGETCVSAEKIRLDGRPVGNISTGERRAIGLLSAPEERLGHAAAADMTLTENAFLTGWLRVGLTRRGFADWAGATRFAERIIGQFDVRTPSAEVAARALSGGNLQKFVIGREIMQKPDVLVVNQPTWGVDAAAAAAIRQALLDLADEGAAIVLVSQDLDELLAIADRFAALSAGRLSEPRPTQELTMDRIGLMLAGASEDGELVAA